MTGSLIDLGATSYASTMQNRAPLVAAFEHRASYQPDGALIHPYITAAILRTMTTGAKMRKGPVPG